MKLSDNDMRVLREMKAVLSPSLGGNGDFDGFIPHGSSDWTAVRRLLREGFVERLADYAVCQSCPEGHEEMAYTLAAYGHQAILRDISA